MKRPKVKFLRKRKPTGYIYLTGSKYCEAEGYLKLRSCLFDTVIDSYPRIVKYKKNLNFTINDLLKE